MGEWHPLGAMGFCLGLRLTMRANDQINKHDFDQKLNSYQVELLRVITSDMLCPVFRYKIGNTLFNG